MNKKPQAILPTWQVPNSIHAFTTLRTGGVSQAPFDSFNLGDHVGDSVDDVMENRRLLTAQFGLPQPPLFLTQTHSTKVLRLPYSDESVEADAVYTNQANQVCLVMTADCLPVLFVSQNGQEIAAAHAGWKGLCDGILENTVAEFACPTSEIQAWLGPAIGAKTFQVGQEVVDKFVAQNAEAINAFVPDEKQPGKYLGDIYLLAKQRLNKLGITSISGGDYCTVSEPEKFFSYRRENRTGRMATLIWRSE
jgi:conserved hypothetical protein, YfiH family